MSEKIAGAGLGLRFAEAMYGSYRPVGEPSAERSFAFHVEARAPSVLRWLRDGKMELRGEVEAAGLARRSSASGEMTVRPLLGRSIRYELVFRGDDGRAYRYVGEKRIRHLHPLRTWTTLPGDIFDEAGKRVGSGTVRFRLRELPSLLGSFRLYLRRSARTAEAHP